MEYCNHGVMQYWSIGVLRIKYAGFQKPLSFFSIFFHYSTTPLLQYSILSLFHYSNTPFSQYSNTPVLQYSMVYIPSTWHTNVITAVATIMLTILVTTAEVAAYPTAEALLSHCIPRRHPERATKTPNTAL
jgi:hypothetical protein